MRDFTPEEAEYLELTEYGSELYNDVKALLIEELKGGVK